MSGATNCPETPRQKMIGMMYLVLTAMLALNVSADIINGFSKLRQSMELTMHATESRTHDALQNFELQYNKDEASKAKYGDWYAAAKGIHQGSDEFYQYLEKFKLDIANKVDKPEEPYTVMPEKGLKAGDDTNIPSQYAFNETDPETGRINVEELKFRMQEYARFMSTPESPCVMERMSRESFRHEMEQKAQMVNTLFNTDDVYDEQEKGYVTWEYSTFHEMPAAAVTALIAKYQNDVRTVEFDMINFAYAQTNASSIVANKAEAIVLPTNGEYVMQGQQYRAKIVSAMMDTTNVPRVFINGEEIFDGIYTVTATSPGEHQYTGYMLLPEDTTHYMFTSKYTVGVPTATISNQDLDIMYRGYDNKFSISVPGASDNQVRVSCNGGTIKRVGNQWIVNVSESAQTVSLTVSTEKDGKTSVMGTQSFRIKKMPKAEGSMKVGEREYADEAKVPDARWSTKAQIIASYGADGILDVPFEVTGFAVYVNGVPYYSKSSYLTQEQVDAIKKLRAGRSVTVAEIKAKNKLTGAANKVSGFTLIRD